MSNNFETLENNEENNGENVKKMKLEGELEPEKEDKVVDVVNGITKEGEIQEIYNTLNQVLESKKKEVENLPVHLSCNDRKKALKAVYGENENKTNDEKLEGLVQEINKIKNDDKQWNESRSKEEAAMILIDVLRKTDTEENQKYIKKLKDDLLDVRMSMWDNTELEKEIKKYEDLKVDGEKNGEEWPEEWDKEYNKLKQRLEERLRQEERREKAKEYDKYINDTFSPEAIEEKLKTQEHKLERGEKINPEDLTFWQKNMDGYWNNTNEKEREMWTDTIVRRGSEIMDEQWTSEHNSQKNERKNKQEAENKKGRITKKGNKASIITSGTLEETSINEEDIELTGDAFEMGLKKKMLEKRGVICDLIKVFIEENYKKINKNILDKKDKKIKELSEEFKVNKIDLENTIKLFAYLKINEIEKANAPKKGSLIGKIAKSFGKTSVKATVYGAMGMVTNYALQNNFITGGAIIGARAIDKILEDKKRSKKEWGNIMRYFESSEGVMENDFVKNINEYSVAIKGLVLKNISSKNSDTKEKECLESALRSYLELSGEDIENSEKERIVELMYKQYKIQKETDESKESFYKIGKKKMGDSITNKRTNSFFNTAFFIASSIAYRLPVLGRAFAAVGGARLGYKAVDAIIKQKESKRGTDITFDKFNSVLKYYKENNVEDDTIDNFVLGIYARINTKEYLSQDKNKIEYKKINDAALKYLSERGVDYERIAKEVNYIRKKSSAEEVVKTLKKSLGAEAGAAVGIVARAGVEKIINKIKGVFVNNKDFYSSGDDDSKMEGDEGGIKSIKQQQDGDIVNNKSIIEKDELKSGGISDYESIVNNNSFEKLGSGNIIDEFYRKYSNYLLKNVPNINRRDANAMCHVLFGGSKVDGMLRGDLNKYIVESNGEKYIDFDKINKYVTKNKDIVIRSVAHAMKYFKEGTGELL